MQEGLPKPQKNLHSIGEASRLLNVSIDTIRRWDRAGKININRTPGGTRLVPSEEIDRIKQNKPQKTLSVGQAAETFGVSTQTLRRWDQQGLVRADRSPGGNRQYSQSQIQAVRTGKGQRLLSLPKPIAEIRERLSENDPEVNQATSLTNQLQPAWFENKQPDKSTLVSETTRPSVPDTRYQKAAHYIKYMRPNWYRRYHQSAIHRPLHMVILGLFLLLTANIMFGDMIEKVVQTQRLDKQEAGELLAATTPPRVLSFQGRLTDGSDVPVSSATNIVFRIYTSTSGDTGSPCASSCLWESKTWSVSPDQNGIFSVLLGDTFQSDTLITAALFSENDPLYLAVKVESDDEMTPRQRIASSAYALNSDALEGFHGSQTPTGNEVPILDASGNLDFGGAASITTTSGNLTLNSAGTLIISDVIDANGADGSDFAGSVTFNDDVDYVFGTSENILVNASTTTNTTTTGILDINATSSANGGSGINLNFTGTGALPTTGQYGMYIFADFGGAPFGAPLSNYGQYIDVVDSTGGNNNFGQGINVNINNVGSSGGPWNTYGQQLIVSNTGDTGGTNNVYGSYASTTGTFASGSGTISTYGGYFSANGDTNGTSTAYGIYATASGADTNYAGYFAGDINIVANTLWGTTATIDFTDFDVSADGLITVANDADGAGLTIAPSVATTNAIDVSDADIVNSLYTGDNIILLGDHPDGENRIFAWDIGVWGTNLVIESENNTFFVIDSDNNSTITAWVWRTDGLLGPDVAVLTDDSDFTLSQSGGNFAGYFNSANASALCWDNSGQSEITDCSGNPVVDYAEQYPTENDVEYKEIVVLGPNTAESVYTPSDSNGNILEGETKLIQKLAKSSKPYEATIIGVTSQNYTDFSSIGHGSIKEKDNPMPVALNGRVPVKVTSENGPINPGDPITTSSTSGAGMKSTRPGYVIGQALSGFAGEGVGTVMVFVNVHYSIPDSQDILNNSQQLDKLLESINLDEENNLVVTLSANTKFLWRNTSGNIVSWISDTGKAFFEEVTALVGDFDTLVFGELAVKKSAQTAGEKTFATGNTEIFIESDKVKENSLINITTTTKTGGVSLYIKEKKPSEGFVVALERNIGDLPTDATASASQTIKFNWLIINQE